MNHQPYCSGWHTWAETCRHQLDRRGKTPRAMLILYGVAIVGVMVFYLGLLLGWW